VDGVVRTASEPTGERDEVGRLPSAPAALEGVIGDELLAATDESRVLSSRDRRKTWRELLQG
jgi:hypothetical protein